ncbi:hypothetical protein ACP70R_011823 [Stipagrostis hirtigluma subsp. patula]
MRPLLPLLLRGAPALLLLLVALPPAPAAIAAGIPR